MLSLALALIPTLLPLPPQPHSANAIVRLLRQPPKRYLVPLGKHPVPVIRLFEQCRSLIRTHRIAYSEHVQFRAERERRDALLKKLIADIRILMFAHQAEFIQEVKSIGGTVKGRSWLANSINIELPSANYAQLLRIWQQQPGIRKYPTPRPMRMAEPVSVALPLVAPIKTATNANNHATDLVHATFKGDLFSSIAIVDSGQVENMNLSGRPHATYYLDGDITNHGAFGIDGSRLFNFSVGSLGAGAVTYHGLRVASVAAGAKWNSTASSDNGHAPNVHIVGYSVSDTLTGSADPWNFVIAFDRVATDRIWYNILAMNSAYRGSGWHNPMNTVQRAADIVAFYFDVLIVASSGHSIAVPGPTGTTVPAGSPSVCNGLAVAAVAANTRELWAISARGPIESNRTYPDLVANGLAITTPKDNDEGSGIITSGTSIASPQVSGAAMLYRSKKKLASAMETKAAILATTEDLSSLYPGMGANDFGMGYLRVDTLYNVALGVDSKVWNDAIDTPGDSKVHTYTVDGSSKYSVALVWFRMDTADTNWSDLTLVIKRDSDDSVLGESKVTSRNLYRRVLFPSVALATGEGIKIEVAANSLETSPMPYSLVITKASVPPVSRTIAIPATDKK